MTRQEVLAEIETLLELDPGSLDGSEPLDSLEAWDSLAVLGVISLADQRWGLALAAQDVTDAATIEDVLGLLGSAVEA